MPRKPGLFERILVPVDFSEANDLALTSAREQARRSGGPIVLLHVIETIRNAPFEEMREFYEGLEKEVRAKLETCGKELEQEGFTVERAIRYGVRYEEIIRYASELEAELIVLSSHRFEPRASVQSWGTISYKVGLLAPCAVLLVR